MTQKLFIITLTFIVPFIAVGKDYTVIDVIGDSVSAGTNPDFDEYYGWVQMLYGSGGGEFPEPKEKTIYTLWPGITAYNSAVSGSTALEWAVPGNEYLEGVINHHPDLVVILIGANDFIAWVLDGDFSEDEAEIFSEMLNYIITEIQNLDPEPDILIMGYYDLFDGMSENLPIIYSFLQNFSADVIEGNALIESIAGERGCTYVSLYEDFFHHCYGRELDDPNPLEPPYVIFPVEDFDIHPVTAGHSKIYDLVYAKLELLKTLGSPSVNGWMLY